MPPSKFSSLGYLEKLDNETPHMYVQKIVFACYYFASTKDMPHLRQKDMMASMVIHCLPHNNPYIDLKNKFSDMHYNDGTHNWYKYGAGDGRWKYDTEVLTTILEVAGNSYEDGKYSTGLGMGYGVEESDGEDGMIHDEQANDVEEDDDDVVEIENPNPVVPEPTIEISSGSEDELEEYNVVDSEPQQDDEAMDEDFDVEEELDDPNDQDFTPEQYKERNDRRDDISP
ncbi:uncharacterized protein [Spinacia oleracea]|nr:uncharacterized protein LOC110787712 isoform X2 [Spinacia oleracea]XP_056685079.1 uncharacterized protein LOC110787712 isoform X2 [Spinacia oleracea]XP_056685080.1 uncharacterized protein LOC110787712 isoform X2 [Spinacia oleracea]